MLTRYYPHSRFATSYHCLTYYIFLDIYPQTDIFQGPHNCVMYQRRRQPYIYIYMYIYIFFIVTEGSNGCK